MNWLQKIKHYNAMDELVETQKETINELGSALCKKDAIINLMNATQKIDADHIERLDKELAEVKKKYEKVCKENRHLEREIDRLKLM